MTTKTFKNGDKVGIKFNDYETSGEIKGDPLNINGSIFYVVHTKDSPYICEDHSGKRVYAAHGNLHLWLPEYITPLAKKKSYKQIAVFDYRKPSGKNYQNLYRVGVVEETPEYIEGIDLSDGNQYKRFLKGKIVGPTYRAETKLTSVEI